MIDLTNLADGLLLESNALHGLLPAAKSKVTSEEIEEEIRKRDRMVNRLDEMAHQLDTSIAALDAYKRILRIQRRTHTTDAKELDTARWKAIKQEKESTRPRSAHFE